MPYNLNIPGWMPVRELELIEQLAVTIPQKGRMVEVGSFVGRSSWCWAKSVDPSVIVYCLDIWNPSEHPYHPPTVIGGRGSIGTDFGAADELDHVVGTLENFTRNTGDCPNIRAMRGASPADFRDWREPLDLVFLDGVHHNPIFWEDLNFWFWHLKPGGILCGDDAARTHPDVVWSIQDFAKNHDLTYIVAGRIWIIPRPPHQNVIAALFANRS
jgi:SAM-dependent methyltransferase